MDYWTSTMSCFVAGTLIMTAAGLVASDQFIKMTLLKSVIFLYFSIYML